MSNPSDSYAYTGLSKQDDRATTTTTNLEITAEASLIPNDHLVPEDDLYLDRPAHSETKGRHTVHPSFAASIPEARGLTWSDTYFNDVEEEHDDVDIVAVFDFDYAGMEQFNTSVGWACLGASLLVYPPLFGLALVGLVPCMLQPNVRWDAQSQHVAITRDGIRFVKAKRRTCWGWSCTDRGKKSQTIPFDKITDCDIEEPAGNTCFCIPNILMKVNIDTASSGSQEHRHQLTIAGLKEPYKFKKLVWAMKRANHHRSGGGSTITPAAATALEMTDRGSGEDSVATLLRDIRSELRQNNELLQKRMNTTPSSANDDATGGQGEGVVASVPGAYAVPGPMV